MTKKDESIVKRMLKRQTDPMFDYLWEVNLYDKSYGLVTNGTTIFLGEAMRIPKIPVKTEVQSPFPFLSILNEIPKLVCETPITKDEAKASLDKIVWYAFDKEGNMMGYDPEEIYDAKLFTNALSMRHAAFDSNEPKPGFFFNNDLSRIAIVMQLTGEPIRKDAS